MSEQALTDEIYRLRSSVAALIQLNGVLWRKLAAEGAIAPNDPTFQASLYAGRVLDDDLRKEWAQAFDPGKT